MSKGVTLFFTLLLAAGCSDDSGSGSTPGASTGAGQSSATAQRSGTITVGSETWTISPMQQCSIYPGNVVNISGYAANDPSLEIVIDYGGPTGARIGNDGPNLKWGAERDTLTVQIDGNSVLGAATFSRYSGGTKESAQGSFKVNCG